ncbi:MAG: NFACT RNA binding domain-containing protein, partial [Balneolaceae bacterium]
SELKKARRTLQQLEEADKALERAETYEQYGHLLMAHAHEQLGPGRETIEIENYYNENKLQQIQVKPDLTIAENARRYYEKATKAKRRVQESKRREKETQQKIHQLEALLHSLESAERLDELEDWENEHSDLLQEMGLISQKEQKSSLPFRTATIDGYEIWIGKNAKSNDELTTRSHKEDIWMHVRGESGSHVVIRMNNHENYPPKYVILRAASYAAWNSKLRGAEWVPVIVTKRKYVSKPKGAPAGTVRVHREEVELVPPKKP